MTTSEKCQTCGTTCGIATRGKTTLCVICALEDNAALRAELTEWLGAVLWIEGESTSGDWISPDGSREGERAANRLVELGVYERNPENPYWVRHRGKAAEAAKEGSET